MTTVREQLDQIQTLENTLTFISQRIAKVDPNQTRLVSSSCNDVDLVRLETIKEFLEIQYNEVAAEIACMYGLSVSGVC